MPPFAAFPFTAPDTTINAQGQVEFIFTVQGNAAFFRVQARQGAGRGALECGGSTPLFLSPRAR